MAITSTGANFSATEISRRRRRRKPPRAQWATVGDARFWLSVLALMAAAAFVLHEATRWGGHVYPFTSHKRPTAHSFGNGSTVLGRFKSADSEAHSWIAGRIQHALHRQRSQRETRATDRTASVTALVLATVQVDGHRSESLSVTKGALVLLASTANETALRNAVAAAIGEEQAGMQYRVGVRRRPQLQGGDQNDRSHAQGSMSGVERDGRNAGQLDLVQMASLRDAVAAAVDSGAPSDEPLHIVVTPLGNPRRRASTRPSGVQVEDRCGKDLRHQADLEAGRNGATDVADVANQLLHTATANISVTQHPGGPVVRLPRVAMATIATGRYRALGIGALTSAALHFGGDCHPSFHLLTDNLTDVDPILNPVLSPFRQWPDSGLSKYADVLKALRPIIEVADFFFFLDADVLFEEDVLLGDVAGDLVGVEHPMYPRDHEGWCNRKDGQPMCGFPYDRNPRSHAYIPDGVGKFFHTTVGGRGVKRRYLTSTWWYLQSAFWGGRSGVMLEMLKELSCSLQ
mmetsp:Transcript_25201/g.65771  ORF Transcript_25201/g.65771 Transcript_25201/m.65771 type:complete len:516 (+) Transcript_25201:266-1813(+)